MVDLVLIVSSAALASSLISLGLSTYLFVKRKPTVTQSSAWKAAGRNLGSTPVDAEFLNKDERREAIAEDANSIESRARMEAMAVIRSNPFALIPPDPAAQNDHAAWRERRRR